MPSSAIATRTAILQDIETGGYGDDSGMDFDTELGGPEMGDAGGDDDASESEVERGAEEQERNMLSGFGMRCVSKASFCIAIDALMTGGSVTIIEHDVIAFFLPMRNGKGNTPPY